MLFPKRVTIRAGREIVDGTGITKKLLQTCKMHHNTSVVNFIIDNKGDNSSVYP
jgi:hypothetical protein